MPPELLADVALRATIPGVDSVFTYRVPPRLRAGARTGQLVWAPLRNQRVQGVILDLYAWETAVGEQSSGLQLYETPAVFRPDPDAPRDADAPVIRDLEDLADPEAALTPAQIRLARWLSEYYRTALYEALDLMLPPGVTQEADVSWRPTPLGMQAELGTLPTHERAVLYYLRQRGEQSERDLRRVLRGSDTDLRRTYADLLERGMVVRGHVFSRARTRPRIEQVVRLVAPPDELALALEELARAPKQRALLEHLRDVGSAVAQEEPPNTLDDSATPVLQPLFPLTALLKSVGAGREALHALERRGLIDVATREIRRDPMAGDDVPPDIPPPLTAAQERAWRVISAALDDRRDQETGRPADQEREPIDAPSLSPSRQVSQSQLSRTFLLHGVTGSGKTELYLRAIGRVLRQGRQALVLVPEIALTTQLVRRFAARFPGRLAVLHSGLGLGERYDEWRRLRSGTAGLAVGSRSAVFAPLPNLGLIIVDEEHEPTYKHDGSPRYHARDVALRLAEITGSVLILGSATPSVESFAAARAGRQQLVTLAERVGLVQTPGGLPRSQPLPLPPVKVVDLRRELQEGNRSIFSRPLQQAISRALEREEQVILFLNRRGAATFVMCRDCGHVIACPNCSSPLAVHYEQAGDRGGLDAASTLLVCHSCNRRELVPLHCPACWSRRIKSFGVGTQRVVEEVETLYPGVRTLRWDRDSVDRKGAHGRMLDSFLKREASILVGTQMIAKGLDLPLVSVVGVIAADTGLHLPDFRAGERTFQLLTQVAGRAGRRHAGAEVIIQTYTPEHYAIRAACEHDYAAFFTEEIAFRRQTRYPPYSRLVRFVHVNPSDERAQQQALALADELQHAAAQLDLGDWGLIGPAPAFFHRQRARYRWHILLRAADPRPLLATFRVPPGWSLDVDPVHVL